MKEITLPSGGIIRFIPEPHHYEYWGEEDTAPQEIPGLHKVMEQYEVTKPMEPWAEKWVERGRRVHEATERYDLGLEVSAAWLESAEGIYLKGYQKFQAEHPEFAKPSRVEFLTGSDDYWMATVVDRDFDGSRILEVKTGQPNPKVHAVQLALQGLLCTPSAVAFERWAIYLDDHGDYDLRHYEDDESMDLALRICKARQSVRKYMTTRRKPTKTVKV